MNTYIHGLIVGCLLLEANPTVARDNEDPTGVLRWLDAHPSQQLVREAEKAAILEASGSEEVIELRAALRKASGNDAMAISARLQALRDAAAARGRAEGLRLLAIEKERARQDQKMLDSIALIMAQTQRDQRIYKEAMRARSRGEAYYVDPATAARIFGH